MLVTKSQLHTHPLAYTALFALFVLSVSVFVRGVSDSIDLIRHSTESARPPFDLGDGNWGAVNLQPEAEEQAMKFGDAVLSVNGHQVDGFFVYYGELRRALAGDRLQVRVQSPGPGAIPVRDLSIVLRPYRYANNATDYVQFALGSVLQPAICIALGFWVAAVRVGDRSAWLLLSLMLSFASIVGFGGSGYPTLFGQDAPLQAVFAAFQTFFSSLTAPALMLFGIGFPERLPIDRRFPWVKWIIAGYLILVSALAAIGVGLWLHHVALARQVSGRPLALLTGVQGDFGGAVSFLALAVCVLSLGWKATTAQTRDARRRLMLLFAGAAPGAVALLIFLVAGRLEYRLPTWTVLPLGTTMLIFPLTMAYVIVVHRAMDVGVVIRQGVQYVLATRGIRVLQAAISVAIITAAATMSANASVVSRVVLMSLGFGLVVGLQTSAGRLRRWIDRQFFREAYESDAILSDLAAKVRTMIETGPLLETVAARIAASLHVSRIAILLEGGGRFRPAYALGYAGTPQIEIAGNGTIVNRLLTQQPAVVRLDDQNSWVQLADQREQDMLAELKSDLLLPLSLNEKLLGIMSLGPKQSEEPFSPTDIRLLDLVALALENGRLTAAVKTEAAARAKQARDIEIARDVQQRLFPQEYPPIPGLDYAGAGRAALGVGGDYSAPT